MLTENHDLENALENFLLHLENSDYFDAHEILEEAWHPLRKSNHSLKNLVKGLINAAICFEHIKRDKKEARRKAIQVLNSYERHKTLCIDRIEYFELFNKSCKKIENLKRKNSL